jgi:transcriptional regulator with PAS, ATPase and Fis domain
MSHLDALCRFQPVSVGKILDALPVGIVVVDEDMLIVGMNAHAIELLDGAEEIAPGTPVCDLFDAEGCPLDVLRETLATAEPVQNYQTGLRLSGGRAGQVLLSTVPMLGESGRIHGAAVILSDVTEVTRLLKTVDGRQRHGAIIGKDRRMRELYDLIEHVGPSDATVLVRGESGTGKELVARAVHYASGRADGPFVMVNCSALSEGLLESELFGHVRGAFTGAVATRRGRFEDAHGGTLFLDEIGDLSPVVQVKLLRVLQERVVEKVGDAKPIPVDVRIVSATNRNLEDLVARGRLREDFYYRIKVVALDIPPLRQRREDIPLLVDHFLGRMSGAVAGIRTEALAALMAHDWPGNVRELQNALEHAAVLGRGAAIGPEHLPAEIGGGTQAAAGALGAVPLHSDAERRVVEQALVRSGWNRTRAARRLGIDRTTLWRKIREYGLEPPRD